MTVDSIALSAAPGASFSPLAIECFFRLAHSLFERRAGRLVYMGVSENVGVSCIKSLRLRLSFSRLIQWADKVLR